jgi:hypothetical protein
MTKWVEIGVDVWIDPTREADRIALNVAACLRIVVAEVVVVEPGLGIAILAGQYLDGSAPAKPRSGTALSSREAALVLKNVQAVDGLCS